MRKFLSVLLIWLTFTSLLAMENTWRHSGLEIPGRVDLYNIEGIISRDDLSFLHYTNPGIGFEVSVGTKCSINYESSLTDVMAVSGDYNKINPVYLIKGAFNLDNAVLLHEDYAYKLYNTVDVVGENIVLNDKPNSISGIFKFPALLEGVSSNMPEIITSIDNPVLSIDKIQLLQACTGSSADIALIESLIENDDYYSLNLEVRYRMFCQLRKGLYFLIALLIIMFLISILYKDLLRRRRLFMENIKKNYFSETLVVVIKNRPLQFLLPTAVIILLIRFFFFIPYLQAGFFEIHSLNDIFFRPVRFIIGLSDNSNPTILLPSIFEAGAFLIITLLFIPGFIGISLIKDFSLRDVLFIPVLNIVFTLIFIFLRIEPVFDFKTNLLLFIIITMSSMRNRLTILSR